MRLPVRQQADEEDIRKTSQTSCAADPSSMQNDFTDLPVALVAGINYSIRIYGVPEGMQRVSGGWV